MTVFLDTSSLIKLYMEEPGSDEMRRIRDSYDEIAVCAIAYTEAHCTIARRFREGSVSPKELAKIKSAFEADWFALGKVGVDEAILRRAGQLCHQRELRSRDAIHLSAALFVAEHQDEAVYFVTSDRRLEAAARKEKLDVKVL